MVDCHHYLVVSIMVQAKISNKIYYNNIIHILTNVSIFDLEKTKLAKFKLLCKS